MYLIFFLVLFSAHRPACQLITATRFTHSLYSSSPLLRIWFHYRYRYWYRRKIPYLQPSIFFGNLKPLLLLRTSFGDYFRALYAAPSFQSAPFFGFFIFHTPALLIRDPQLIEQVLIKEFNHFPNRYEAADLRSDPMGALTLPLAKYAIWRKSRSEILKLFTSGQLKKKMYPKLLNNAEQLEGYITRKLTQTDSQRIADAGIATVIEVKEMCALYTTDVTAALLYSVDLAGLMNDGCEMRAQCEELFKPSLRKILNFFAIFFLPTAVHALRSKVFARQYAKYLRRLVAERITTSVHERNSGDLIDLLLHMQQSLAETAIDNWLRHPDFIAAQVGIFLLAGFETSSSLIAFVLYELAKQPQIQTKLKAELALNFGTTSGCGISYKRVLSMPYLNMVVAEGLRLYPTAPFINRECLPNGQQQTLWYEKGSKYVSIPKGVPAYISILGIHSDPKYWRNPLLFDPQRFAPENLPSIKPMTYIPFGAGPHGCVGNRLGILQAKLALIYILKRHRVEVCEKTVKEIRFDPKRFMLEANAGLYLKFVKEEEC